MKISSLYDISQFYNTMCSYFFMPFFLPPAKVTDKSKTLINIFSIVLNSLLCVVTLHIQSLTMIIVIVITPILKKVYSQCKYKI